MKKKKCVPDVSIYIGVSRDRSALDFLYSCNSPAAIPGSFPRKSLCENYNKFNLNKNFNISFLYKDSLIAHCQHAKVAC